MGMVLDILIIYRSKAPPSPPVHNKALASPGFHNPAQAPYSVLSHSQYDLRENSKHSEVLIDLTEYCGQLVEAKCLTVNPQDNNCLAVGASGPFVRLYDIRMIHNHRYEQLGLLWASPWDSVALSLIAMPSSF